MVATSTTCIKVNIRFVLSPTFAFGILRVFGILSVSLNIRRRHSV